MNKTLTIALAGFSFTIEEHAYIKLNDYLKALRNTLEKDEAEEVMYDIEARIVEIFKETQGSREVIYDTDVEKVISLIGRPEQIEETEDSLEENNKYNTEYSAEPKQLFRDPVQKKIAGVCAGLAAYIGLDITAMRIIWFLAFFALIPLPGSPSIIVIIYIVLWLILPKATTAADFLKMRGKPLNFDNLKNESNNIIKLASESSKHISNTYLKHQHTIKKTGNSLSNFIRYGLGIFLAVIGITLLVPAFMAISDLALLPSSVKFFIGNDHTKYIIIGTIASIPFIILALLFIYLSIKLFSPKTKFKYLGYTTLVLGLIWLITIGFTLFFVIKYQKEYRSINKENQNIAINTSSDSLWVETYKVNIPSHFTSYWDGVYSDGKTVFQADHPQVTISTKDSLKAPYLIIKSRAQGYNHPMNLKVPVKIEQNKVRLPNYINYPYQDRMRSYDVEYNLIVPSTTKVLKVYNENTPHLYNENDEDENDQEDNEDEEDYNITLNSNGVNIKSSGKSISNFSYNINGNSIKISSNKDSIQINGKSYDKKEAKKIIKEMDIANQLIDDIIFNIK